MDLIKKHLLAAIKDFVLTRNGVIISDGGANQFSCVFATVNNRFFAITASHCLNDIQNRDSILIGTFNNQSPGVKITPKNIYSNAVDVTDDIPKIDIGVIELNNKQAEELKVDWFKEDDLTSNFTGTGAFVCLAGFPTHLFSNSKVGSQHTFFPRPFIYLSQISDRIPPSENLKISSDPSVDIYIEYSPINIIEGSINEKADILKPQGLSGCGILIIPLSINGHIWTPSNTKLAGIQSSYIKKSKLLRAKRIEHLYALLNLNYKLQFINQNVSNS